MGLFNLNFLLSNIRDKRSQTTEADDALAKSKDRVRTAENLSQEAEDLKEVFRKEIRVRNHLSERFNQVLRKGA